MRLTTEHNGSKIKGPYFCPLLSRRKCKACRVEARIGLALLSVTDKLTGCQWFCFYVLRLATKLIRLEC